MAEIPTPTDRHQELYGMFSRCEIDRDIVSYSGLLRDNDGEPLIGVALDVLRKKGHIRYLDAGCGTGRAAWSLKDQLAFRTRVTGETIDVVGINDCDFRNESELVEVRRAVASGKIKYIIGDLDTVDLAQDHYDLITCVEVLIHNDNEKASRIINKLLSALAPGGKMYFTLREPQRVAMSPSLDCLSGNGFSMYERRVFDQWAGNNSRIVTIVEKGKVRQEDQ